LLTPEPLSVCGLDDEFAGVSAGLIDTARRLHRDERGSAAMDVTDRGAVWVDFHRDVLPSLIPDAHKREVVATVLTISPLRDAGQCQHRKYTSASIDAW
jgi:hypothetical protein